MIVWWNGSLCPLESVRISPLDRGFLYGDGLFETIRLQYGKPLWLSEHLERLRKSLSYFNFGKVSMFFEEDRTREIISDLYEANPHLGSVARLKIIVTRGEISSLGLPEPRDVTIIFMATPYDPPSEEDYKKGWPVEVLPGRYSPPLGRHKSLNYLFYLLAKEHALQRGFKEAIIEDTEARIIEASTANVVIFIDGRWIFPSAPWKLEGITERIVERFIRSDGEEVISCKVTKNDIFKAQSIWLVNSLIGVMPVSRVDDYIVPEMKNDYAYKIRERLFSLES
ncbi:MAG: aminotransferase class IV [Syntrophobacterales bacterium]|nr:aminotransferase class IV [Syntrophobacterales bacterium]